MATLLWEVQKEAKCRHAVVPTHAISLTADTQACSESHLCLEPVLVFTHCCKWTGSIHWHVSYAYILSVVTSLVFLSASPQVKVAQRKTDFKGVLLANAKQSSSVVEGKTFI